MGPTRRPLGSVWVPDTLSYVGGAHHGCRDRTRGQSPEEGWAGGLGCRDTGAGSQERAVCSAAPSGLQGGDGHPGRSLP